MSDAPSPRLVLVRHAMPAIVPDRPSRDWALSPEGRRQAEALVPRLDRVGAVRVVTSAEPKAVETGKIIASGLSLPPTVGEGLQENDRTDFPFFQDEADLHDRLRAFFALPNERVIGHESADEAHARFLAAVRVVTERSTGVPIVVTHGTVMTLLVSRANALDPYDFWSELRLTSMVTLDAESFALHRVEHPPDLA